MPKNYPGKAALVRAHQLRKRYASQSAAWRRLCDAYLPETDSSSIWRHSAANPTGLAQGWKLHIPATIFTAVKVLKRVGPLLKKRGVPFKAPSSLNELGKLNAGIFYGYTQVGKFLTIYPSTEFELRKLARELHRLTHDLHAPTIPFDRQYRSDSRVYYRYGSFIEQTVEHNGRFELAIQEPSGKLIPDRRDIPSPPPWVRDPFTTKHGPDDQPKAPTLLTTRFKAFRALSQRGKGGVYQALDFSMIPPRLCILKEGRRHGELRIDGRDGYWRIQHEERVLKSLASKGVHVQSLFSSFRAEKNYYIALEYFEGETLGDYLDRRQRRLSLAAVLRTSIALADLIAQIHRAGWVWRDCKPQNLIFHNATLRAIDFEGACTIADPDPFPWGTHPYTPPESEAPFRGQSRLPEDLYALGKLIFLLSTGRLPDSDTQPIQDLRTGVPNALGEVVAALLDEDPRRRPTARNVKKRLAEELRNLARNGR